MIENDSSLIVISLFSGRKFPFRSKYQLIAEGRFDGELLATDPIEHLETVDFKQELAWSVDKKALHQHRLQRSSIKIQFYAIDKSKSKKESLGYIILDLRSANQKQPGKWLQILHSKYSSKPEVSVAIYIDKDKEEVTSFERKKDKVSTPIISKQLKPILNEEGGYFQIGDSESCSDEFILSVTIAFATNLINLLPADQPSPLNANGFYFYYTLMGSEITQDPFYDLIHPKFQSVRASVHVRSSIDSLRQFFKNQSGIEIHLCSGDQSLGRAVIKLDSLIQPISTELYMKPVTLEGTFELEPPNRNKIHAINVSQDSKPKVGASISLHRLQDIKVSVEEQLIEEKLVKNGPNCEEEPAIVEKHQEEPPSQVNKRDISAVVDSQRASDKENIIPIFDSLESSPHHYCFSLNMKILSELKSDYLSFFIRYSYPFFGVADPISSPLIEKSIDETEVVIPQGFCAFDFAALESQVIQTFTRVPLKIELLYKENSTTKVLAEGEVDLRKVLKSQNVPAIHSSGVKGVRKLCNENIELAKKIEGKKSILCKIMISLCLEDWGFLNNQQLQAFCHDTLTPKANARSTEEYKTALELEIWKERQKHKYEEQLREKERNRMEAITDEWKCREKERELLVKKKIAEYTELETQLRKTLLEVEKKEKHLIDEQESINKMKHDLQYEHDRKMKDIKDAWERITVESEHKLKLERSKADSLREEISKLRSEIRESENKYISLDKDFRNYKDQLTSKPECRLQSEINMLNLEKSELEKKLLVTTNAKVHYKQQWAKAINELARFRIKEQASAKHQLKKQHQELQQLKMRYLAAEENDITKSEKRQLEMIKEELNKLRIFRSPSVSTPNSVVDVDDEHLSRLIEERDTLLQTGTYNSDDKIIMELEKQIRECISKHNR